MFTWISDIFRTLLSLFDRVVYWFIELLVSLFDQLANVRIFDDTTIGAFSRRIFFLISILMIFKVSFSIIKYIINPDTFTDNEKGMGKVIQSVILVLVSLACIQSVFKVAYGLQKSLLDSQIIEQLILGVPIEDKKKTKNEDKTEVISAEQQIASKKRIPFYLLSAFIKPNATEVKEFSLKEGMYICTPTEGVDLSEQPMYDTTEDGVATNYRTGFGTCITSISKEQKRDYTIEKEDGTPDTLKGYTGEIYNAAQNLYSYSLLLDLINDKYKTKHDIYLFEYQYIVSTAAGIFFVIMYLNFCIDLAIRSVKFGFLQLIAPIPIISMIDPKSSKGGMMSKWVQTCISTYLGLFIRIAVVNFAIFIITLIFTNKITVSGGEPGIFMKVVILFGAIMFAKEAPKLINDLTGGKLSGDFKMNPLKRIPGINGALKMGSKIGGAALTGAIGGIGGGIAAGMAMGANANAGAGKVAGSTVMGMFRGAFGGMKSGYGAGLKGVVGKSRENIKGIGNRYTSYGDSTLRGRLGTSIRTGFGLKTEADDIDNEIKILEDYAKFKGQMKAQADFDTHDLLDVANNNIDTGNGQGGLSDILGAEGSSDLAIRKAAKNGVKGLKEYYEDLQNSGTATAQQITNARNALETAQKYVITHADDGVLGNYVDDGNGNISFQSDNNRAVAAIKKQASSYASRYSGSSDVMRQAATATTYQEINEATIAAQTEAITKRDASYDRAVANRDAVRDNRGK